MEFPAAKRQKRNNTSTTSEEDLVCAITLELPADPVLAEDGHVYERSSIEEYFDGKTEDRLQSPLTRELIGKNLLPATEHKNTIERLIQNGTIKRDVATKWTDSVKQKQQLEQLKETAEAGNTNAMFDLGGIYYSGQMGVKEDSKKSYFWYRKAHDAGYPEATSIVGYMLVQGLGVARNCLQGVAYLGVASKRSNYAAFVLGMAFADGKYGLEVDRVEARRLLEFAVSEDFVWDNLADSGRKEACLKIEELKK